MGVGTVLPKEKALLTERFFIYFNYIKWSGLVAHYSSYPKQL
jgi:hypothetical protein